jgi:hypothetical protein
MIPAISDASFMLSSLSSKGLEQGVVHARRRYRIGQALAVSARMGVAARP